MNYNHCNDECTDDNILDSPITFDEIHHVVTELPLGKAPGSDGLVYEMYKSAIDIVGPCMVDVFNRVMECGEFPDMWAKGILCVLHKKG